MTKPRVSQDEKAIAARNRGKLVTTLAAKGITLPARGQRLVYHEGGDLSRAVKGLAGHLYQASELGMVDLVQRRLGVAHFAYEAHGRRWPT